MNARPEIPSRFPETLLRLTRGGLAGLLIMVGLTGVAQAQSTECTTLGLSFQKRQATVEQIQGFNKKPPTAEQACAAFTRLASQTSELVKSIEENGSWCHVPQEILPSLQAQVPQIAEGRKNSCNAADQQRKAKSAPSANPFGGGDSVIGGAVKMPKGAL